MTKRDHILGHKIQLKFKRIEIIQSMVSGNNVEIRRGGRKCQNIKRLHILLNNTWVKEVLRKILKYFELHEDNITYQNLWHAAKAMLRGKFIALNAYIRKQQKRI